VTATVPEIARDRYGRPLVIPPGGGRLIPYTRCTTFVGCLEDTSNLTKWKQRMTAIGLTLRPDLALAVAAHRADKSKLNKIVEEAMEAAASTAAATTGTALHSMTEEIDRGVPVDAIPVPADYVADLQAYEFATAPLTPLHIEQFTVHDGLQVAGTPDRVVEHKGSRYIADVKTGSIEWGMGKIAMQLAVYANSAMYDVATGERTPLDVDTSRALVIHLPAGQGRCDLVWMDIAEGWRAVQVAAEVRKHRQHKAWSWPFGTGIEIVDWGSGDGR
jgi:hypothetical protein